MHSSANAVLRARGGDGSGARNGGSAVFAVARKSHATRRGIARRDLAKVVVGVIIEIAAAEDGLGHLGGAGVIVEVGRHAGSGGGRFATDLGNVLVGGGGLVLPWCYVAARIGGRRFGEDSAG